MDRGWLAGWLAGWRAQGKRMNVFKRQKVRAEQLNLCTCTTTTVDNTTQHRVDVELFFFIVRGSLTELPFSKEDFYTYVIIIDLSLIHI